MGNSNSGRPRKPKAHLKLMGSFREDRQGDRFDDCGLADVGKPAGLSEGASVVWDEVVPKLVGLGFAKDPDVLALSGMCEWVARYRYCLAWLAEVQKAVGYSVDREETELIAKIQSMVNKAWTAFTAVAIKFGFNPADRAKLAAPPKTSTSDFDSDVAQHA